MATHIQIGDISPRVQYTADGVQTAYTYPFPIFADADVQVYEGATLKTLATDYTVTGAGNSTGGVITFAAPPPAGAVITLKRTLAIRRTTDFQESGEFRAKVINDELDYQTAALQQVNNDLTRGLRLADTDSGATILPDLASRMDKVLAFDANGDVAVSNQTLTTMEAGSTNAAASALAAGTSATNAGASAAAAGTSATNAGISATAAAASAAAANVAKIQWQGAWVTATAYAVNDAVFEAGSSYICLAAHTSGVFATDLAAVRWELLAQKGIGDLVAANNLSDVAGPSAALANIGGIGAATVDTLTNKTLTSPLIGGGTIDNAVIGGATPAAIAGTVGSFSGAAANQLSVLQTAAGNNGLRVSATHASFTASCMQPWVNKAPTGASKFIQGVASNGAVVPYIVYDHGGTVIDSSSYTGNVTGLSIRQSVGNTYNPFEIRDSTGAIVFRVSPSGAVSNASITAGATAAEKADIMLNSFRIAVNGGLAVQNMVDGVVDEFSDQTGVDTVTSTNETYDAVNKLFYTASGYTADQIPTMTSDILPSGTVSASAGAQAPEWQAFDKDTATVWAGAAATTAQFIAYEFAAAKTITQYTITPDITANLALAPAAWTFEGWTGTAWVVLDTQTGITTWLGLTKKTFSVTNTTAYIKYRINITAANGGTYLQFVEMEMMESVPAPNMTLQSIAAAALAQPDNVFAILRQEDVDAVALNTDLTVEASRDGGVTWTAVPLAEAATLTPGRILSGSASIATQPIGTAMKWRVKTLNNKAQKIHAVGLEWS